MASQQLVAPKLKNVNMRDKRTSPQSDDSALVRQIRETHSPGRSHSVNVNQILQVIEEIFHRASHSTAGVLVGTRELAATVEDRPTLPSVDVLFHGLSYLIQKIYCEISCQCSGGGDVHATTMELLRTLSNYSWEAKVVLTLAAFAVYYGEFWLVAQLCTSDPLAKSVAILKQLSDIVEHATSVKPQIEAIDNLIKAITNVTKRIVEYGEMVKLESHYISEDTPPLSIALAHIPAAAYWVIRGILASASHVAILAGSRHEYIASTTEVWELSSLAHKLNNIHDHLTSELENCRRYIVAKRYDEDYETLKRLFQSLHLDNLKNLRALISHKDDAQPLQISATKSRYSLEVLRRRHVLLLITDLSLSNEEIQILEHIYKEQQNRAEVEYEIVWLPVVDVTTWDEKRFRFEELKSKMQWYVVHDPLIIEPPVIKFIRNDWHFDKKMIIVSLDPQGRVSSLNAVHMLWVWGNLAFPFTDEKEQALWNAESWRLQLVADGIDSNILDWIDKGKYICLYGGDDLEWIRKFTVRAKAVAGLAGISLELLYVGRSTATRERIRKVNKVIETENLSRFWPDYTSNWFFWSRMDSMRCSKAKHHKTVEIDGILKEVMTLLSYDGSDQGWVMVWKGSNETARGNGKLALDTLDDFEAWKNQAADSGFVPALKAELIRRHTPHHCTRLIIPGFGPDIPDRVECAECGKEMEKFFMFRCCTD
ncbi:protein SIEVE ELEMENT OCCLUSION B-like [Prunus avium]|uniref:Protein SIEVE ELEMENT OCCLUSION B-like n=1 Tax=Prunus avium TaxID=42229 RepID=A0A6P5RYR7_PRUAV|nr:protein SIEVE ELEMENT OCCLUSION B-like [Prunus avium]